MSKLGAESNRKTDSLPLQETLRDALDSCVSRRGERPALGYFTTDFTFSEVRDFGQAFGSWLREHNIGFGDRVLVQLQNVPQFLFVAAGIWEIGAVVVPLSPMYRAREISIIAADSGARVWVTTPKIWEQQGSKSVPGTALERVVTTELTDFASPGDNLPGTEETAQAELPTPLPVSSLKALLQTHAGRKPERPQLTPSDIALFAYTSGTTGPPKAALTSHGNLCFVGHAYATANTIAQADQVAFALAPLVHITALAMHLAAWLTVANKLVLAYRFNPKVTLEQMAHHGVTSTVGTATAYQAMLQVHRKEPHSVTTLEFAGAGGSSVPAAVTREFKEAFGIELQPGYGLTETTGAVTSTLDRVPPRVETTTGVVSVGPTLPGFELKIVDDDGHSLSAHQRGEVLVRGAGVAAGYWKRDDDDTFRSDGWARTGDVGFLDEDRWLYIVDRTKNLIVASGYKVWPRDVEDVLYNHPAVQEAAVVGAPDEYRGETVVAFIALKDGSTATSADLIDYCRAEMAAYKVPSKIVYKSELPKNFNGKIRVRDLKAEGAQAVES